MKKYSILLLLILLFLVLVICLPRGFDSGREMFFIIEKGQGSKQIALGLEENDLIWFGPFFRAYVLATGVSGKLQAGTYQLSPSMNLFTIARKLASGDIAQEKITIIEGWNLKDIAWYFENRGMFQAEELFELNNNSWQGGLEGYLFPDTYLVRYGASLAEIVQQMQDNFDKKTAGLMDEITRQNKQLSEIITMASLIEKEVRTKEDKEIVSGIFWKRIRSGKPLESCASIAFIKGIDQWIYSFEDTRIESSYNTYLNYGLPVGPICNPGLESILAALYPQETEYWYHLSTPEGETIFSRTFEEHTAAKNKYLK